MDPGFFSKWVEGIFAEWCLKVDYLNSHFGSCVVCVCVLLPHFRVVCVCVVLLPHFRFGRRTLRASFRRSLNLAAMLKMSKIYKINHTSNCHQTALLMLVDKAVDCLQAS